MTELNDTVSDNSLSSGTADELVSKVNELSVALLETSNNLNILNDRLQTRFVEPTKDGHQKTNHEVDLGAFSSDESSTTICQRTLMELLRAKDRLLAELERKNDSLLNDLNAAKDRSNRLERHYKNAKARFAIERDNYQKSLHRMLVFTERITNAISLALPGINWSIVTSLTPPLDSKTHRGVMEAELSSRLEWLALETERKTRHLLPTT